MRKMKKRTKEKRKKKMRKMKKRTMRKMKKRTKGKMMKKMMKKRTKKKAKKMTPNKMRKPNRTISKTFQMIAKSSIKIWVSLKIHPKCHHGNKITNNKTKVARIISFQCWKPWLNKLKKKLRKCYKNLHPWLRIPSRIVWKILMICSLGWRNRSKELIWPNHILMQRQISETSPARSNNNQIQKASITKPLLLRMTKKTSARIF